jgi:hypothetical protein
VLRKYLNTGYNFFFHEEQTRMDGHDCCNDMILSHWWERGDVVVGVID